MKPRVMICRATPVDPDPRIAKISHSLHKAGYQVSVVGWDMSGNRPTYEHIDGVNINRCRLKVEFGRGLANIVHQLRWQWVLFSWLRHRRHDFELIHACDFDTLLPALLCKRLWKKKVIYDIFDFYADMLRATPERVVRLVRRLDLRLIGRADAIILADEARLAQIAGSKPKQVAYIYNALTIDSLPDPEDELPAIEKCRLRIAYVGNLQVERGLLVLLEVLRCRPEFHLDLAGFGGDQDAILAAAQDLPNVHWHGRVDYKEALLINQAADVLIATYDPGIPNHRYSSPNKVFEAMLLGKPVVVARDTHMDTLIEREQCGLVVEYGDAAALEAALLQLSGKSALRKRLGNNARHAYATTYNWEEMERRLLVLYREVEEPAQEKQEAGE